MQKISEIVNGELRAPTKIPKQVKMIEEEEAPPPTGAGVVGGVPGGTPGGVMSSIIGSAAAPPKVAPQKLRISAGVAEGLLIRRIEPQYPPMAKIAHMQGEVLLQAMISKAGNIENLRALSGPPLLIQAAMDAVKQWKYRPYLLNGEPVEVDTQIRVNFHM